MYLAADWLNDTTCPDYDRLFNWLYENRSLAAKYETLVTVNVISLFYSVSVPMCSSVFSV